jgi:hypothetical protein
MVNKVVGIDDEGANTELGQAKLGDRQINFFSKENSKTLLYELLGVYRPGL